MDSTSYISEQWIINKVDANTLRSFDGKKLDVYMNECMIIEHGKSDLI